MSYRIILAESRKDRRRALAFVRRHVRRLYGGIPPPSQILLFAEQDRRICGTMALDFVGDDGRFHLEEIYCIDHAQTPWPLRRSIIAQFSKWWATRPGVSVRLMHAAHEHALASGKQIGLVEVKPRIVARVSELGMTLVKVAGATLRIERALLRSEGYYQALPPPELYMFDLQSNVAELERYMNRE